MASDTFNTGFMGFVFFRYVNMTMTISFRYKYYFSLKNYISTNRLN